MFAEGRVGLKAITFLLLAHPILVDAHVPQRRISLNYSPVLPHARYDTDPPDLVEHMRGLTEDPIQIAKLLIGELHRHSLTPIDFRIRDDSYTDESTGITHIYATQVVEGLDVVDAVMNIHVRGQKVITFGDSFYTGPFPNGDPSVLMPRKDSYSNYCRQVNALTPRNLAKEQPMFEELITQKQYFADPNCRQFKYLDSFSPLFTNRTSVSDPRHAALLFSVVTHARTVPTIETIESLHGHCDILRMEAGANGEYLIRGIPGTLVPVEAKLVYVQQPDVDLSSLESRSTTLTLAWRLVVDLQDNWYEATVDARDPTHIISVVDWVSDAFIPHDNFHIGAQEHNHAYWTLPDLFQVTMDFFGLSGWISTAKAMLMTTQDVPLPLPLCSPGTPRYNVWKWGINDPDSGSRSLECSVGDSQPSSDKIKAASPWGWHSMPANKVPSSKTPSGLVDPINFNTTFGNNVFAQENWGGSFEFLNNFRPDGGPQKLFDWPYISDCGENELHLQATDTISSSSSVADDPTTTTSSAADDPITTTSSIPDDPTTTTSSVADDPKTTSSVPDDSITTTSSVTDDPITTTSSVTDDPIITTSSVPDDPMTTTSSVPDDPTTTTSSIPDRPTTTTSSVTDDPITTTSSVPDDPTTTTSSVSDDPITTTSSLTDDPTTTTSSVSDDPITTTSSVTDGPIVTTSSITVGPTTTTSSATCTPVVRNPKQFINVPITQLFYTANMFHDLMYLYGFTEKSGNFQQYNFKRGGIDSDAVIVNAQDGTGRNWANFATPPDGQHGRLRYLWTADNRPYGPWRDGALDTGMVIHELMHGVSSRLVGGSLDSGCLRSGESGGISEGISDFVATLVRMSSLDDFAKSFPIGAWSSKDYNGLRRFNYTANSSSNPITYESMNDGSYRNVHSIGAVWAEMLFQVFFQLASAFTSGEPGVPIYPFSSTLFPSDVPSLVQDAAPTYANQLMLGLVMKALSMMPCKPTFINARDALLKVAEDGPDIPGALSLKCWVWLGFAARGLGYGAKVTGLNANGQGFRTNSMVPDPSCVLG